MKPLNLILTFLLSGSSVARLAPAQTITPLTQEISLPGSPFAVTTSTDGHYVFASLSGNANGIAIIRQERNSATLVRVLATQI